MLAHQQAAAAAPILEFNEYDLDHAIAGRDEIRAYNLHRHEMEQLTAVVFDDPQRRICVGYKDLALDEFWVRGQAPGQAVMPRVLVCECAGQLCSYYVQKSGVVRVNGLGFAGIKDLTFFGRDAHPGERLAVVGQLVKVRAGVLVVWSFQAFVEREPVCQGTITGVPLPALATL